MADFGSPATPNYTAPDGLQTLGSLMSLKHKQQGLVQQQLEIRGQQAQTQITEQDATQRAAAAHFFNTFDLSKHVKDDGTLDLDSAMTSPELKATGDLAPTIIQNLVATKSAQLGAKTALAGLNNELRDQFKQTVGGLSNDSDVIAGNNAGKGKVLDGIQQFVQSGGPDAERIAQIYGTVIQHTPPDKLSAALKNFKLQAQAAGQQLSTTTPSPTAVQGKGGLNFVNTNPNAPGPVGAPVGQPVTDQGLAPTEKPSYIAERTGAGARATGTAGSDIDRSNEVASLQQQSKAAIPLTQRIDQLSHEIASGNLAKKISETGNWLGFSSVNEARSQLNKDLGQVKALAIARSGSDARAATVLEGYPTDTTPEATVHAAMDYIRGTARQNLARGNLLSQYQKEDQGLKGFQAADNVLAGKTDPLMHEYLSLKPEEQAGFYRRNFSTPQEAQAFKDEVNALKKHTHAFGQ